MLTRHTKTIEYYYIITMICLAYLAFVFIPGDLSAQAGKKVKVFVNGISVGIVDDKTKVEDMLNVARKRLAKESNELILVDYSVLLSKTTDVLGRVDDDETIINNIYEVFTDNVLVTKEPVYEVKINEFTVNLRTADEVLELLNRAKHEYDPEDAFDVDVVLDPTRELNVLTTQVSKKTASALDADKFSLPVAGAYGALEDMYNKAFGQDTSEFDFGVKELDFGENVEIVQAYADSDKISTLDEAINMVTKEQEKSKIYEVVAGDSLSVIAEKNNTSIDDLIALNSETIPNSNATLRVGDEIKVNSPTPELSVVRTEEVYYEETYNAPVKYIDNDSWYTNESKVVVEPVDGFRKVVADITYRNDSEESRDIVYEDVVVEAVAKVVERGTKVPPTYLKPISGGRLSSTFGRRKAPKKGASTFHKGVDWATPVGTAVCASSGGTVVKAGWGSGYGYVVYIQHPDGKQTRYGHLSKILVKNGQSVRQGEKIALSGNTGVSTGPHIHFEILVGGGQVNPFSYLN